MKKQHFHKRALERFKITIKDKHQLDIINKIKKGRLKLIKQDKEADLYELFIDNKFVVVVYDREKECLKTILFPNAQVIYKHNKRRGLYK